MTSGAGGNGKAALRRRLLTARAGLSAQQRAAAEQALRDAVLGLPQAQMAGTAAVYYSIGSEPGTHGLVYALWKRGTYVLLPVLRPDMDLDWASYEGPDSLRPGPRGLTEPAEPPRGVAAVSRAEPGDRPGPGGGPARGAARPGRRQLRPRAGQGGPPGPDDRAPLRRRTA